ncbi:hypothetical protein [Rhizobium subbaraonis]|uniref:hypothetical protein n=1 Tax=Rhizobium subbaraonis TaxID=908946 RepID=UPI000BE2DCB2|nr:hypothetical protein [Rhizobium subbaraonis]
MSNAATSMAKLLRIFCAIALLCVGFAHKPPVLPLAPSSLPIDEVAQYVLPDGTLPVLCLPSEDGKAKHQDHTFGPGCEACRLSASIILPSPGNTAVEPVFREVDGDLPSRVEAHYRQLFPPNTFPRGPPSGIQA